MIAIVRLYHDSFGSNVGSRIFLQMSKYFGGVLVTDNKKIQELDFPQITHKEALQNIKKFTKLIVYNSKANMFGGLAPKNTPSVVSLIKGIPQVYYFTSDPILDLQLSVPDSHERAVPGLTSAVTKMIHIGERLNYTNTDLMGFLAASLKDNIVTEDIEKEFDVCYFGNFRHQKRQEQIHNLLMPFKGRALIVGHESEEFAWHKYSVDFYKYLSTAWTTPIIGDERMHYETGVPSIRLYEACCSTAIVLIDSRFKEPFFDRRFFFNSPEEFVKMTKTIIKNPGLYAEMLKIQRKFVKKVFKKFGNKTFDWRKVLKKNTDIYNESVRLRKEQQILKIKEAKKKLIKKGIIKK